VTAASFVTLTYWAAFGAVAVYLIYLVCAEVERRRRIQRMRELRLRRALRDAKAPQRWTT
jgi:hypothetical protein